METFFLIQPIILHVGHDLLNVEYAEQENQQVIMCLLGGKCAVTLETTPQSIKFMSSALKQLFCVLKARIVGMEYFQPLKVVRLDPSHAQMSLSKKSLSLTKEVPIYNSPFARCGSCQAKLKIQTGRKTSQFK